MSAGRIRVRVERLVLEGVPPALRRTVAGALENELARQLGASGAPTQGATVPSVSLSAPAPADGAAAGRAAGAALARAISRGRR